MVENRETECLPLRVSSKVRLKAKRVDRRHERLYDVQWRPGHRRILRHVTAEQHTQPSCLTATLITPATYFALHKKESSSRANGSHSDTVLQNSLHTASE